MFNLPNNQFGVSGRLVSSILVLVFSVVCVGLFQFMRHMVNSTENELDRGIVSPSDFTIIIRQLPAGGYTSEELKKFLEEWWEQQYFDVRQCTIVKINIAYDIFEYSEFCLKKNQLVLKKRQMISYKKDHEGSYPLGFTDDSMTQLNDEIKATQTKIDQFEIEAIQNHNAKPSQIAFVTFLT